MNNPVLTVKALVLHLRRCVPAVTVFGAVATTGVSATLTMNSTPFGNGNGLHGGEYAVTSATLSNAGYSPLVTSLLQSGAFATFCLEYGEHFSFGSSYTYTLGSAATLGSGGAVNGADPASNGTAWLYSQFATGVLANYDYTAVGRAASNSQLQLAFWFLEDETPLIAGYGAYLPNTNVFLSAAIAQFGSVEAAKANAANSFGVSVLNLTTGDVHNQSQLYYSGGGNIPGTPDSGATLALMGLAVAGMMGFRRAMVRGGLR